MGTRHPLFETWDEMLDGEMPNLLRLHISPHVAQACLCLSRYVQETWYRMEPPPAYQTFLANGFDEALCGAIKLARFCADVGRRSRAGLVIDREGRTGPLVSVGPVAFIPDLQCSPHAPRDGPHPHAEREGYARFGFVVLFPTAGGEPPAGLDGPATSRPLVIVCLDRPALARCQGLFTAWQKLRPDIVVFDESFVRGHVPFGAFTARKALYNHWNRRGFTTFHSTTYQPNTLSSLHFLKCLEKDDAEFFARLEPQLDRVADDPAYRKAVFARLYSPSLARATAAVGWDTPNVRAAGHYLTVNGRRVFDGVAGVACSIRGHNPPAYRQEMEQFDGVDYHRTATERLAKLTGLGHLVPAVSGASAVENALRLGLVAQFPRKYVLAFRGGFGGKTLLALTGTANPAYKRRLDPLYEHVVYVDPFGANAIEDLEAALVRFPVGIVQLELVQAVGGVRAVPERLLQYLQAQKQRWGYLLFVDEVQTGMYRTGPFLRSREVGIDPDLVTIGKGTSDMMFPFSVTLYSARIQERLAARDSDLAEILRRRFDYEFGYKTLLNVLERADECGAEARVRESGALFQRLLTERLSSCPAVRDVRVFGLLIGVELDARRGPRKWFKKQAGSLYVLSCLRHEPFPVFLGYCQYEPYVLKLTPPLSITREEVERVCDTLAEVLRTPMYRLLPSLGEAMVKSFATGRLATCRAGRT